MYRPFLSLSLIAAAIGLHAQTTVHQVVLLNEGHYDYVNSVQTVPVSLGTYDPSSGLYTEQVIVPDARFGNDVKVQNEMIYVSADSFLLKYDANTFALLDQEIVHGIRRIALWNDQILITRGEYGGLTHYFEVRDKNTFDLLYMLEPADGMPYSCEAVEVLNDKAYIAMNNGFDWPNYTSLVGVVDLASQTYETDIDLGPDGLNPEHLMVSDGALYAFNNKDYTGSSVSKIDPATSTLSYTNNVAVNSGCGTSTAAASKIYYMEYSVNQLARFDLTTEQVLDTLTNGIGAYGTIDDPINGVLYVTTTDYLSSGELYVTSYDGTVQGSVAVGVAAGKMALDLRTSTGVQQITRPEIGIAPNPAVDHVVVAGVAPGVRFEVLDADGRSVLAGALAMDQRIDLSGMKPGIYAIRFADGPNAARLVKP